MRLHSRHSSTTRPGLEGTARVDRRLSTALRRARPGDVLVVDHVDLDRAGAEAVVASGAAAVVNAAPFISGRYPNLGPELLVRAGVLLLDEVGPEALGRVKDGATVRLAGDELVVRDEVVATGTLLDQAEVAARMEAARSGLATQLASLTHNTTELLRREEDLLLHGKGFPALRARVEGRPAVVVVRAFDHEQDLRRLRRFVREQKPLLVGVDGGGDALLEAGLTPDVLVVGERGLAGTGTRTTIGDGPDGQSVSDRALSRAREVVLHTDPADRLLGADRLDRLGVRSTRMAAGGLTEDVALLLAHHHGASLLVTVGTHTTLEELLDRRRGMASSFLTRLRVGPQLVDAGTVPLLYSGRVRLWQLVLVALVGLLAVGAAVASTPVGHEWAQELWTWLRDHGGTLLDDVRRGLS